MVKMNYKLIAIALLALLIIPSAIAATTVDEPDENELFVRSVNLPIEVTTDIGNPSCKWFLVGYSDEELHMSNCEATKFNVLKDGNYTLNVTAYNATANASVLRNFEVYRGEFITGKLYFSAFVVFFLLAVAGFFGFLAFKLDDEHYPLKFSSLIITFLFVIMAFQFALVTLEEYVKSTLADLFSNFWFVFMLIFIIILFYLLIHLTKKTGDYFMQRKQDYGKKW